MRLSGQAELHESLAPADENRKVLGKHRLGREEWIETGADFVASLGLDDDRRQPMEKSHRERVDLLGMLTGSAQKGRDEPASNSTRAKIELKQPLEDI